MSFSQTLWLEVMKANCIIVNFISKTKTHSSVPTIHSFRCVTADFMKYHWSVHFSTSILHSKQWLQTDKCTLKCTHWSHNIRDVGQRSFPASHAPITFLLPYYHSNSESRDGLWWAGNNITQMWQVCAGMYDCKSEACLWEWTHSSVPAMHIFSCLTADFMRKPLKCFYYSQLGTTLHSILLPILF